MVMKLFSFFDNKAKAFSQPFVMPSEAEAYRGFMALCQDSEHKFCVYAEDYELYYVGDFDDKSGLLTSISPERIKTALQAKAEITDRLLSAKRFAEAARKEINITAEELAPQGLVEDEKIPTLRDCIEVLEQQ